MYISEYKKVLKLEKYFFNTVRVLKANTGRGYVNVGEVQKNFLQTLNKTCFRPYFLLFINYIYSLVNVLL